MKQSIITLLAIILGVAVLLIVGGGVYLVVEQNSIGSTSNAAQAPISAPIATPAVSTTQEQPSAQQTIPQASANNAAASVDEAQGCAQQSNANYNTIIASVTKNAADLQEMRSFTNHFNAQLGECFMVITFADYPLTQGGYGSVNKDLYDVYENKKIAFDWKTTDPTSGKTSDLCVIYNGGNGAYGDCTTDPIFEQDMESATF